MGHQCGAEDLHSNRQGNERKETTTMKAKPTCLRRFRGQLPIANDSGKIVARVRLVGLSFQTPRQA
ncbi:hypothetical protein QQP08_005868 [Theobroma cacao]|nr:hypothetical protein QQP08_005868 [Theobroma cacao]